jgi:transposase
MLNFSRQRVRIRVTEILFPRNLITRGFPTFRVGALPVTAETCTGARLVPFYDRFVVEILYEVKKQSIPKTNNHFKSIGINLGITNLIATSDGLLVKGGVVKTINQWCNKRLSLLQVISNET